MYAAKLNINKLKAWWGLIFAIFAILTLAPPVSMLRICALPQLLPWVYEAALVLRKHHKQLNNGQVDTLFIPSLFKLTSNSTFSHWRDTRVLFWGLQRPSSS